MNTNKQPSYDNNKDKDKDKYNIVNDLQNYMFSTDKLKQMTQLFNPTSNSSTKSLNKPIIKKTIEPEIKERYFFPSQKDSLFWCFYRIVNESSEMLIEPYSFVKEKNEKIKWITTIRNESNLLKQHKITKLVEIEDDLANKETIQITTFIALCIVNKLNILYVNNRSCFELLSNDSPNIHVIFKNNNNRYGIELEPNIKQYKEEYFKIHQISKPLLSVGSYKVAELNEFVKQLQIQVSNKMTKPELYNLIVLSLNKN